MYAHPEEEDHHRASALLLRLPEVVAYHPVAAAALAVEVVVAASLADLLREVEASFPSSHYLEEVALLPFLLPDVVAVGGARVALALMAFHLDVEDHPEEVAYHYPQEEEDVGDHYYYRQEEEGSCSSYVRYPPTKKFSAGRRRFTLIHHLQR
jgi:hypothetical protein